MSFLRKRKKSSGKKGSSSKADPLGARILLALFFVIMIASFIHFREVKIDLLEIDRPAKKSIVAQVDFEFPDPDATLVLKQEALRDIGRIFKISDNDIKRVQHKFENYLIHHPNWRKSSQATFEEVYNALEAIVKILSNAFLTDSRTLKKRTELDLPTENFYTASYLDSNRLNTLPDSFWDQVKDRVVEEGNSESTTTFVIDYFKGSKWKVYNDIDSQRLFRQIVQQEIPEKYTKIGAGTKLINEGEKVTDRHMAMVAYLKKTLRDSKNLWNIQSIFSSLLFSFLLVAIAGAYLYLRQYSLFKSPTELSLYATIIAITLILTKLSEWLFLHTNFSWIDLIRYPVFVPFAAILICVLLNQELALFSTFFLTVVMGITLAVDHNQFLFINLITGSTAIITAPSMKRRKEVFIVTAKVWLAAAFTLFAFNLAESTLFTPIVLYDFASSAINLLVIAILLIGLMPVLESIFNVMTDMTLMEYMNPTNELLRRLSMEAPGTYQHSISLGHIAENVAYSIGANGLFCRVTTLYHDIGKLNTPHYFTENIMLGAGKQFDIHQLLTAIESAYIIKSHVPDGVALAKQHNFPQPFIDIIQQHHGTTLIKYFYRKQIDEVGGNVDDVDEFAFRYPGPKPQSKEAAIIMIVDSVEAASRTLEDNSEESIKKLINAIVGDKIADGQFDESPLTFKELFTVKEKLVGMIKASHHLRIKYPDQKTQSTSEEK